MGEQTVSFKISVEVGGKEDSKLSWAVDGMPLAKVRKIQGALLKMFEQLNMGRI